MLLANLRILTSVAYCDEMVVDESIASEFDDFEDAMQYYSALKVNVFVTHTFEREFKRLAKKYITLVDDI